MSALEEKRAMTRIDSERSGFYNAAVDRMNRGKLFRMMMSKNALRAAIFVGLAIGGFGIAAAQTTGASVPTSAPGVLAGDATRKEENLSPQQMRSSAQQYLPAMELSAQAIRHQLEQARENRDVVKVLCLNDKLNQVDVALRSATERVQSLVSAVERNELDQSRYEFTVTQVLRDRVRALAQEAAQCIGEETGFIGESKVSFDIDPAIPAQDPANAPDTTLTPTYVPPPTTLSPTR